MGRLVAEHARLSIPERGRRPRGRICGAVFPDGHTPSREGGLALARGDARRGTLRVTRDLVGESPESPRAVLRGRSQHPARGAPGPAEPEPRRLAASRSSRPRVAASWPSLPRRARPKGSRFVRLVTYHRGSGTAGEGPDELRERPDGFATLALDESQPGVALVTQSESPRAPRSCPRQARAWPRSRAPLRQHRESCLSSGSGGTEPPGIITSPFQQTSPLKTSENYRGVAALWGVSPPLRTGTQGPRTLPSAPLIPSPALWAGRQPPAASGSEEVRASGPSRSSDPPAVGRGRRCVAHVHGHRVTAAVTGPGLKQRLPVPGVVVLLPWGVRRARGASPDAGPLFSSTELPFSAQGVGLQAVGGRGASHGRSGSTPTSPGRSHRPGGIAGLPVASHTVGLSGGPAGGSCGWPTNHSHV